MATDSAAIEFRLLGPVEAVANGRVLPIGGRKQRALLALLLLEGGRPVSANHLVEELWQGRSPPAAATTLRSYVSRLRTVLGAAAVVARPPGYALEIRAEHLDVHRFERLLREGREALARGAAGIAADRLHAALALWRGEALADVADGGTLALEAQRLEELRLACLEERIEADLALGRHTELAPELERLVEAEPLRERLWRQLVLALYRCERQSDALAAYRRARTILDEQLGLEPSEELKELERAVLQHDVPSIPAAGERHNLPAPVTSFVGRELELRDLERLLREQRLVTLTGVGGSGKTRLAIELAWRQVAVWPGGVWLVDLTGVSDPTLVPSVVAAALGVTEQAETLAERVRASELLLVLDNCEHVASAVADLVADVLRAAPHLRVLATSRIVLGAPGEFDYAVDPLRTPPEGSSAEELERSPSVRLFLDRGRAARRDLEAPGAALDTVARICRELDGLPLAIELAAARAKALSLEEIAGRLSDRFRFLRSWRRIADPRHQTLRATMDWSYDLLATDERALLPRLAVFADGFTLEAVAAAGAGGDAQRALELVGRLVDASLVVADRGAGGTRYRLLETVRQYAGELLGDAEEVYGTHARYFLDLATAARLDEPGLQAYDLLPEQANFRAALEWSHDRDPELGLRLATALEGFWAVTSPIEGVRWLERLLQRVPDAPLELRAPALRALGSAANPAGQDDVAERAYAQSLAAFRALVDYAGAAVLLLRLGYSAIVRSDTTRARALAEESLAAFSSGGNRWGESQSVSLLGEVEYAEGRHEPGMELIERSVTLAAEAGFTWWRARMLGILSDCALEQGSPERAERHAREAVALSRELGDRLRLVRGLARLARFAVGHGERELAGRLWGAIEAEEARGPVGAWESERAGFERVVLANADAAFARGRQEGRKLSLDEAIAEALRD